MCIHPILQNLNLCTTQWPRVGNNIDYRDNRFVEGYVSLPIPLKNSLVSYRNSNLKPFDGLLTNRVQNSLRSGFFTLNFFASEPDLRLGPKKSGSLMSFLTGELGSTEAVQNNVWTKTVTTHRNYGPATVFIVACFKSSML